MMVDDNIIKNTLTVQNEKGCLRCTHRVASIRVTIETPTNPEGLDSEVEAFLDIFTAERFANWLLSRPKIMFPPPSSSIEDAFEFGNGSNFRASYSDQAVRLSIENPGEGAAEAQEREASIDIDTATTLAHWLLALSEKAR